MPPRCTTTAATALAVATSVLVAGGAALEPAAAAGLSIPRHATIVVRGHGWGHGRGMSQYGAEGAARQGLSAQKIVRFYYPHTQAGTVGGNVTVWIEADTDDNTTVLARPGLLMRDLAAGTTRKVPTTGAAGKATRWRMSGRGTATRVSYRTDGWHTWRTLTGAGEFRSTGKPLTLLVAGDRVSYRGTLQSIGPVTGHPGRITVNKVSLENYVRGVLAREMPSSWHQAALRAQAIAARTYAAYKVAHPLSSRAALCDTSDCQVYGGTAAETPSTDEAVAKTADQVRLYDQKPAFTEFSSSNGGWLAKGDQPYLVAKPDPYDGWSGNPNHTWRTTLSDATIEKRWPSIGNLRRITVTQRDGNGQWNGRIESMKLVGSTGTKTLTGDAFRGGLGLKSTWLAFGVS
ncbi:MAG TPA: SpoIID/LytB domain-containing protein [Nocardioides sp.]|uniref:SpoIID/LytB domain-containing protein n=1 Tax=Nocardioides sp. TaxID=35761 RepID=UPI002F3F9F00